MIFPNFVIQQFSNRLKISTIWLPQKSKLTVEEIKIVISIQCPSEAPVSSGTLNAF